MTAKRDLVVRESSVDPSREPCLSEATILAGELSAPVRRLLEAGLGVFAERGFHAATTREIAARAGMSPAALYIHFRAKTDVLYSLSRLGHLEVLRQLHDASAATTDPIERIRQLVETFTAFHVHNHRLGRVVQYEHRALASEQYESILELRRQIDGVLRQALVDAMRAGALEIDDVSGVLTAIASLCIDVVRWRETAPRWSAERLASLNGRLVLSMLGAHAPTTPEARELPS